MFSLLLLILVLVEVIAFFLTVLVFVIGLSFFWIRERIKNGAERQEDL